MVHNRVPGHAPVRCVTEEIRGRGRYAGGLRCGPSHRHKERCADFYPHALDQHALDQHALDQHALGQHAFELNFGYRQLRCSEHFEAV